MIWIGGFKLLQGSLLAVVAVGVLRFVDQDVAQVVGNWITQLHFNIESGFLAELLEKLDLVTDTQLRQLSGLGFVFAGVLLTEGVGLIMKQRWAEYLTVFATGSLIPLELYETIRHFGPVKLTLLGINVAIVWFLIRLLRGKIPRSAKSDARGSGDTVKLSDGDEAYRHEKQVG